MVECCDSWPGMQCKQWCYTKAGADIPTCSYFGLLAHHLLPYASKVCCSLGSVLSTHVSTCQLMAEALDMCSHLRATPSRGMLDSAVRSPVRARLLGRIHLAGPPSQALAPQARQLPPMRPKLALQLLVRLQRLGRLARMGLQLLGRRQRLGRLARMGQPHLGRPQRLGSPTAIGRLPQGRALRPGSPARTGQPLPARQQCQASLQQLGRLAKAGQPHLARPQRMGSRARMAPRRLL